MAKELEKSSFIIFSLSMVANVLNYVFQIVMGRMLPVGDFGAMNALFSITILFGTPCAVLALVVAKYSAEFSIRGESGVIPYFIKKMLQFGSIICGILIVGILIFSSSIYSFLKIEPSYVIILFAISIGLGAVSPVISGGLQGLKRFTQLGIFNVLVSAIKLSGSILLVYLSFHLYGIFAALILSSLISIFYGYRAIRRSLSGIIPVSIHIDKKAMLQFSVISLITSICIALFTNIDMVLVKHFFSETQAGLYGSVMQFGKILLYLPTALVLAMFPLVAETHAINGNTFHLLRKSLLYCGMFALAGTIVFNLFPEFFIHLLFGEKYLDAAPLMLPSCLMVIPVVLNTILMNFSLAINKGKFIMCSMLIGCAADFLLIFGFFHSTVASILYTLTIIGIIVFAVNLFYLSRLRKKQAPSQPECAV